MRVSNNISGRKNARRNNAGGKNEQGVIITLVAVFVLFVVGAMAALSIDVVTLYTARSEAQLAADGAALAGARVLANSGMTSDPNAVSNLLMSNAQTLASTVATQVATGNSVGGTALTAGQVNVSFTTGTPPYNPHVTVQITKTDLPTFFARIWGRTQVTVGASATAEAYNPSVIQGGGAGPGLPVQPMCVKPWLLPNISPATSGDPIFNAATGAIGDPALLGWESPAGGGSGGVGRLKTDCTNNCAASPAPPAPAVWQYYPGTTDPAGSFPAPSATSCTGCTGFNSYQLSIAGCVQTPIACNTTVNVDTTIDANRDTETRAAVNALTHSTAAPNSGDSIDTAVGAMPPTGTEPFQFLAGSENPIVLSGALGAGTDVTVSDSLVTVPVIDTTTAAYWPGNYPNVQIIGFVQLFLNPTGAEAPFSGHVHTRVINLVGCGDGTGGVPAPPPAILGNGSSAVAVRLISPP
jgi:Putative Flp pilus-assembly TadE/G-like